MFAQLVDTTTSAWVRRKLDARLPYPPASTAVVLVDVQHDFFATDAGGTRQIKDVAESIGFRDHLVQFVDRARDEGILIVHAPFRLRETTPETRRRLEYCRRLARDRLLTTPEGVAIPRQLRDDDDVMLEVRDTLNVFYGTALEDVLQRRGIEYLLVAGTIANASVDSTGRMGVELDYDVTFVRDCIAAFDMPAYRNSIEVTFPRLAHRVLSHREILDALK